MSTFKERLKQAADYAGVEFSQTPIARSLGITSRQTVDMWMTGSIPGHEMIVHIATTWKVDPVWLGSGQGEMLPKPPADLSPPEREILQIFRTLNKERRASLQAIVKALAKAVVLISIAASFAVPHNSYASAAVNIKFLSSAGFLRIAFRRWIEWVNTMFRHANLLLVSPL